MMLCGVRAINVFLLINQADDISISDNYLDFGGDSDHHPPCPLDKCQWGVENKVVLYYSTDYIVLDPPLIL